MSRNGSAVSLYHIPASADPKVVALTGAGKDQILIVGAPLTIQDLVDGLGFEVEMSVSDARALLVSVPFGQNARTAVETLHSALRKALPASESILTCFPPEKN